MREHRYNCIVPSALVLGFAIAGCGKSPRGPERNQVQANASIAQSNSKTSPAPVRKSGEFTRYTYEIVNTWPHDRQAFTQGLVIQDGQFLESTGLNGQSSLRRVDLKTGMVIKQIEVPAQYFAEGLTVLNGRVYQLTWQSHKGFVYDLKTFRLSREFAYDGEGWGLTTDGQNLILSDGSSRIRFLDPSNFAVKRAVNVTHNTWPVERLNELEYVKGEIFANVWGTEDIVIIDPITGKVTGVIDLTGLLPVPERTAETDVLNGIAYDPNGDRLFVTGKRWPKMFEVRLKSK